MGLWFVTIDYVNSEMLWLQNSPQGYFKKLAVEDDEMSQIGIPITELWDVCLNRVLQNKKVVLQHFMRPAFMNTINQENESPWIKLSWLPAPFSIGY